MSAKHKESGLSAYLKSKIPESKRSNRAEITAQVLRDFARLGITQEDDNWDNMFPISVIQENIIRTLMGEELLTKAPDQAHSDSNEVRRSQKEKSQVA